MESEKLYLRVILQKVFFYDWHFLMEIFPEWHLSFYKRTIKSQIVPSFSAIDLSPYLCFEIVTHARRSRQVDTAFSDLIYSGKQGRGIAIGERHWIVEKNRCLDFGNSRFKRSTRGIYARFYNWLSRIRWLHRHPQNKIPLIAYCRALFRDRLQVTSRRHITSGSVARMYENLFANLWQVTRNYKV